MIDRRAAAMTLDAASGKTYAELANEHGVSVGRVGQIITNTLQQLRLSHRGVTKEEIGTALARRREREPDFPQGCTPKSFYWGELTGNLPVPSDSY